MGIGAVVIVFIVLAFISIICGLFYKLTNIINKLKIKNINLSNDNEALDEVAKEVQWRMDELDVKYVDCAEKLGKTVHQKKSSEVRLGKIGENLAPFTDGWPWDPNNFRFLGSPIDGMQFTQDRIYLVEIKTGKARLSKKQARCKELVKQGKISFISYRIDTEGHTLLETPALSE